MTYNESRKNSSIKYNKEHQKRIPLSVKNELYDKIKEAASTAGESVNGYIKAAVLARMEQENKSK